MCRSIRPLLFSDMKYTLTLDVPNSKGWGLNLSESALFAWLFSVPSWAEKAILDGEVWHFAARSKAIEETGGIITDKPDTIYRLYKSLESKGVIRWQKIGPKDYIQITAKGACWNSDKKTEVGKFSEQTRKKIRTSSEKNPTYNNTIDNETNDKEDTPAEFHVQIHSLETITTVEGEVPRPDGDWLPTADMINEPDWMQVAKDMEAYAKGEGAAQWRFMCEAQGYKGEVLPIVSNWASKASKYQLMNWKSEFRKLQTWLKTESRADYKAAQRNGTPAPATSAPIQIRRDI